VSTLPCAQREGEAPSVVDAETRERLRDLLADRVEGRCRPITLRFMRSVAARTPSAYASDWRVAWNLAGSLHTSPDAVRETLFHEIFHLNDEARSSDGWSFGALGPIYDAIVKKCGARAACLAPYTPNDTMVRGGTYYSFQPGNDVREYAAELGLRYYREQRAVLRALPRPKPFKCGPPENRRAWALMRDEQAVRGLSRGDEAGSRPHDAHVSVHARTSVEPETRARDADHASER
jgi:hypothetical protein